MRADPGAGFALGGGDLDVAHQLGNLAAERNRVRAALQRGKIESFMRRNQVDDAGTAARPVKAALEQRVRDRGFRHRHCRIPIEVSLKHL